MSILDQLAIIRSRVADRLIWWSTETRLFLVIPLLEMGRLRTQLLTDLIQSDYNAHLATLRPRILRLEISQDLDCIGIVCTHLFV